MQHLAIMEQIQQDGLYTTLVRERQPDASLNHPTGVLYAVVDTTNQRMEGQMKSNIKNPHIWEIR